MGVLNEKRCNNVNVNKNPKWLIKDKMDTHTIRWNFIFYWTQKTHETKYKH